MLFHIQECRGIAILAVVLFHLSPDIFPNGYLGVDVYYLPTLFKVRFPFSFFVISGFIMAKKLSELDNWHFKNVDCFYSDRLCRILPLYFLVTAALLLACQFMSTETKILQNLSGVPFSLTFLKNMKMIWDEEDYFGKFQSDASSSDLLLHTWSISIEMQFFAVIPILFMGYKLAGTAFGPVLLCASILFSLNIWMQEEETFRFNHLATRFWQFGAGILAHEKRNFLGEYQFISNLLPIALLLFPIHEFDKNWVTPVLVVLLCFLFASNADKPPKHSYLVFLGNISYSLYLIHWPVVVFLNENRNFGNTAIAIAIIFLLSVAIYEFFEQWYRRLPKPTQIKLSCFFVALNLLLYSSLAHCPMISRVFQVYRMRGVNEERIRIAIEKNVEMVTTSLRYVPNCIKNVTDSNFDAFVWYWGVCDYPMILWLQILYDPFVNNTASSLHGEQEWAMQWIERQRADYAFILTRFDSTQLEPGNGWLLEHYQKNIQRLEISVTSKLFILGLLLSIAGKVTTSGPAPVVPVQFLNKFIESLSNSDNLDKFNLNRTAVEELEQTRRLLSQINCTKCEIIDPTIPFLDADIYSIFNETTLLSYMDNDMHYTSAGIDALRPLFTSLISKFTV